MPVVSETLVVPFTVGGRETFTERLIARLEPWMTPSLQLLVEAIGAMFEPLLEVAEEEGEDGYQGFVPAYGRLLDPNTCPAKDLPYLGQFVGVEVPSGASEAEARELVKAEAGLARGTKAAVETAIKRVLGTAPFTLQERTAESGAAAAYHFNVLVGVGKSSQALYEAIDSVRPAGVWFSIIETSGAWIAGTKKWNEVAAGVKWSTVVEGQY